MQLHLLTNQIANRSLTIRSGFIQVSVDGGSNIRYAQPYLVNVLKWFLPSDGLFRAMKIIPANPTLAPDVLVKV